MRWPIKGKDLDSISDLANAVRQNVDKMAKEEYNKQLTEGNKKAIALFKQYIHKYSFQNFDQVSFFERRGMHPFSATKPSFLFWHRRGSINILDTLFHKEVMNGNFIADQYASTADQNKERYYMILPKSKYLDSMEIKTKLAEINKERATIYLESIENYSKKLAFQAKKSRILFCKFLYLCF